MNTRLFLIFLSAALAAGCAPAALPTATVTPSGAPAALGSATIPSSPAATIASPSARLTPAATIPTIGGEQALAAGTYRLNRLVVGDEFPPILVTVPDGWFGDGPFVYLPKPGEANVAVQFWDVMQVYGHPCQWGGTLTDPGPTVDDLVNALVKLPLRSATPPLEVTLGDYSGKYLELSVPADVEMDEQGNFSGCDRAGEHADFKSWTGRGFATDRYHQGPGQVDRLWILDVNGARLVIDAFSMPSTTAEDLEELLRVVESIRFER